MRPTHLIPLLVISLCVPAFAQTTRPTGERDQARENADLKAYAQHLEDRIAALEAKVKALESRPAPASVQVRPLLPAPYDQAPGVPFNAKPSSPPHLVTPPLPSPHPNWTKRQFNGMEYYLVPLR